MSSDTPGSFDASLRAAFEPQYVLERELTGGGMSRVFLAVERALNRQVVIKVLPPELAAGVNRERFRREIQLAAQLQHPHIVPLYSAGEHGDLLYYTMPFIEGESLKHAIHEHDKNKQFTLREVVRILHDVSDALAYAHARGVIHRDIKPGNVLRSGVHAVVTDFGVAKAISAALPAVGMTTSGMAIGTPAYMAPEQLAGDPAADHRIDIYAVGLLAYELLTGEAPFNETSPQATLAAQMTREPAAVSRKRPDVPSALAALVMKCLAKSPDQRPQTAQELVVELDAMAIGSGDFAPARKPASRWGVAVAGLALAVVAVAIARRSGSGSKDQGVLKTDASAAASPAVSVAPVAPAPPALTRAESLAIASAVEKRMATRTAAAPKEQRIDSATLAQIRSEAIKVVFDSLQKIRPPEPPQGGQGSPGSQGSLGGRGGQRFSARAPRPDFSGMTQMQIDSIVRATRAMVERNVHPESAPDVTTLIPNIPSLPFDRSALDARAANMGPPRRIVVADPPPDRAHPELQTAGAQMMDSLRKHLDGIPRFVVVNHDSVTAILQHTRSRDSVMHAMDAEVNATIRSSLTRGQDSVRWNVIVYDVTSRNRVTSVTIGPVPIGASAALADSLAHLTIRALQQLDHAPRRTPSGSDSPRP